MTTDYEHVVDQGVGQVGPDPVADPIERIRDRITLWTKAQTVADADPKNEVAADAADDLLDTISDRACLDVPLLLAEVDRLRAIAECAWGVVEARDKFDIENAIAALRDALEADR